MAEAAEPAGGQVCAGGACAIVSVFTGGVADEWRNLYATLRRVGLHPMAEQPVKTVRSSRQDGRCQAPGLEAIKAVERGGGGWRWRGSVEGGVPYATP